MKVNIRDFGGTTVADTNKEQLKAISVCVFVFDLTRRDSFVAIANKWLPLLDQMSTNPGISKVLIGNKSDLCEQDLSTNSIAYSTVAGARQVSEDEVRTFAERHDMRYAECSCNPASRGMYQDRQSIEVFDSILRLVSEEIHAKIISRRVDLTNITQHGIRKLNKMKMHGRNANSSSIFPCPNSGGGLFMDWCLGPCYGQDIVYNNQEQIRR